MAHITSVTHGLSENDVRAHGWGARDGGSESSDGGGAHEAGCGGGARGGGDDDGREEVKAALATVK